MQQASQCLLLIDFKMRIVIRDCSVCVHSVPDKTKIGLGGGSVRWSQHYKSFDCLLLKSHAAHANGIAEMCGIPIDRQM